MPPPACKTRLRESFIGDFPGLAGVDGHRTRRAEASDCAWKALLARSVCLHDMSI
jgi:hypothetical protein